MEKTDLLEYQKCVIKARKMELISDITYFFMGLCLTCVALFLILKIDEVLLSIENILLYLCVFVFGPWFLIPSIKHLFSFPFNHSNDRILNATININQVEKIIWWIGGKEGKFDVTFFFKDGSKEEIRFYNDSIFLQISRLFESKFEQKNKSYN
jgi:hypothetical protein